jgi:biotin carboxyl carrier protein
MQYEVEIGGRRRHVVVARTGDDFAVTVDGHTRQVDAARIDAHTLSLVVDSVSPIDTIKGPRDPRVLRHVYEVSVARDPVGGQLMVHVGASPIAVTLNGRRTWGRKVHGDGSSSGPQRLMAPMPGKVVRLLVKAGDTVGARQPVVVVEAMKMENELRASRDGTVTEVHAREGMSVDAGALLIVIQ